MRAPPRAMRRACHERFAFTSRIRRRPGASASTGKAGVVRLQTRRRGWELSALMRAAQDGDQAAYAPLVRRTMPLLQRALRTRNRFLQASDRDDLMQKLAILSSGDGGI